MDQLLEGIFSNYAAESRAHGAVSRLRSSVVDLNELRVSPVSEIVEIVGADYPMGRAAAEELNRTMASLFNRTHKIDLMFLTKQTRKGAETFLNRLDGLGAYAKATVLQRCFKAPVVPVDVHMLAFLKKGNYVPAEAAVEDIQKFLAAQVRDSETMAFFVHLKRHAAAHAPRKPLEYQHVPAPTPPPIEIKAPVPVVPAKKGAIAAKKAEVLPPSKPSKKSAASAKTAKSSGRR
jgi:endonuclease III